MRELCDKSNYQYANPLVYIIRKRLKELKESPKLQDPEKIANQEELNEMPIIVRKI